MSPIEILVGVIGTYSLAVSALAAAVVFLYRREAARSDVLDKLLEEERKKLVAVSEDKVEWALKLADKQAAQNAHNASIAEALLRGDARRRQ